MKKKNEVLKIENKTFGYERALYNTKYAEIRNCSFKGEEDGESALKECKNLLVSDCEFLLRYPLWHCENVVLQRISMADTCRASLWYDKNVMIEDSTLNGIKALRECKNIYLTRVNSISPEFGWRCKNIKSESFSLSGEYVFFQSKNINFTDFELNGKYSFQYTKNVLIENSKLNTKDAFWHSDHVTLINCEVNGEYLAWYSNHLTLINCTITGTQPLCYCKNLKLINCKMPACDLAFEYSDVHADLLGSIKSIKNPKSGLIKYEDCEEIVLKDSKYAGTKCKILKNNQFQKN